MLSIYEMSTNLAQYEGRTFYVSDFTVSLTASNNIAKRNMPVKVIIVERDINTNRILMMEVSKKGNKKRFSGVHGSYVNPLMFFDSWDEASLHYQKRLLHSIEAIEIEKARLDQKINKIKAMVKA